MFEGMAIKDEANLKSLIGKIPKSKTKYGENIFVELEVV